MNKQQQINLPTDKIVINCNKQNANIETNKNNELIFNLIDDIPLNNQDKITLYKAFINIKGQNESTITLDTDFKQTMDFHFYIPQDLMRSIQYDETTKSNFCCDFDKYQEYYCVPSHHRYRSEIPANAQQQVRVAQFDLTYFGHNGSPAILVERVKIGAGDDDWGIAPITRQKSFTISAGQYSVSALAARLTRLANGEILSNDEFNNINLTNRENPLSNGALFADNELVVEIPVCMPDADLTASPSQQAPDFTANWDINKFGPFPRPNFLDYGTTPAAISGWTSTKFFVDLKFIDRIKTELTQFLFDRFTAGQNYTGQGSLIRNCKNSKTPVIDGTLIYNGNTLTGGKYFEADRILIPKMTTPSNPILNLIGTQIEDPSKPGEALNYELGARNLLNYKGVMATPTPANDLEGTTSSFENITYMGGGNGNSAMPTSRYENMRTIGAKEMSFTFGDATENRFTINNQHSPYRISTYDKDVNSPINAQNSASVVGSQATKYGIRNMAGTPWIQSDSENFFQYPVDCSSGIMVRTYDYDSMIKQETYKKYKAAYDAESDPMQKNMFLWAMTLYPHEYYYKNEDEAKKEWSNNLFNRMGFTYEQLGNITNHLEEYQTFNAQYDYCCHLQNLNSNNSTNTIKTYKTIGITTHNSASISNAVAVSGLGETITPSAQGGILQTFSTVGAYINFGNGGISPINQASLINIPEQSVSPHILTTSQNIIASLLPTLSLNNYFVIMSDIIPNNYLDPKASKKTAIGFITKENSFSDIIFSTDAIDFTITQPKILSKFSVKVTNPDGSDVSDDIINENSAFIFIVERNRQPEILNN